MNADVEKAVERDWSAVLENAGVLRAMSKLTGLANVEYIANQLTGLCADHRVMAQVLRDQDAEIASLRTALANYVDRMCELTTERDALQARIAGAPTAVCRRVSVDEGHIAEISHFELKQDRPHISCGNDWIGKRVALMVVE